MNGLIDLKTTMTSNEIAELTGKLHKNVIRDIEDIIKEIKDSSNLSFQAIKGLYTIEGNI